MGLISCVEVDKMYMKRLDFLVCCAENQLWFLPLLLLFCIIGINTAETPSAAEQREKTQHSPSCPSPDLRRYVMRPLTHKCATLMGCSPQLPVQLLFCANRTDSFVVVTYFTTRGKRGQVTLMEKSSPASRLGLFILDPLNRSFFLPDSDLQHKGLRTSQDRLGSMLLFYELVYPAGLSKFKTSQELQRRTWPSNKVSK